MTCLKPIALLFMFFACHVQGEYYEQLPTRTVGIDADPRSILWADDFVLQENTAIAKITWWGNYNNLMAGQFEVQLYSDVPGAGPGNVLPGFVMGNIQETFTGRFVNGPEAYYTGTLQTPFAAQAGVRYWLSVADRTLIPDNWQWELSNDSRNPGIWRSISGGPWEPHDLSARNMAFAVPEPRTTLLFGFGLGIYLALGLLKRK